MREIGRLRYRANLAAVFSWDVSFQSAVVAVQVALGSGYYLARQQARKDEYASGFSKGLIMGLPQWELRFVIDRFWDNAVAKDAWDEEMPAIRANAHSTGLTSPEVCRVVRLFPVSTPLQPRDK